MAGAQPQPKIEQLNTVLEEYADELARGEFLVVPPGQIRGAGRPRGEDECRGVCLDGRAISSPVRELIPPSHMPMGVGEASIPEVRKS
jgi:hypothetical protein